MRGMEAREPETVGSDSNPAPDPDPDPQLKLWETGVSFCGSVSLGIKQASDSASFTGGLRSEMRTEAPGRVPGFWEAH